ncbi:glutathione peroxidase [Streptococcus ovuberis]|uniref:Glutathione peroxidase n=1 Tax=Streptococcus ovuberis TaxID=1936207 RepID=A0A7X6N0S8_9STRE|nr:glutathione peroxidase [Streptococcus ovuberis]NKZ21239.1 glutathione peroxidase [Streptococcus ovuberis]
MSILYDLPIEAQDGTKTTLEPYKGKVLLIVNTATACGLTPQYQGLQELYDIFHDQGLEVLDFPCNQFMNQAPEDDQAINHFCQLNYQTTFARFKKIAVNGPNTCPLFQYLKEKQPGHLGKSIKWNFTKFLVNRQGQVVARFSPQTEPAELQAAIQALL